jgi:hypothetical protein
MVGRRCCAARFEGDICGRAVVLRPRHRMSGQRSPTGFGGAAEAVSKHPLIVAADVSRLTILGISYEIRADSSRFAGLLQF